MRICYLDESEQQQDGVYYVGALVVDADQVRAIDRGLDELHGQLKADHPDQVPDELEFHGHAMFQGEEGWSAMDPGTRAWASQRAVDVICSHALWFGFQGVDTERLHHRPGWEDQEPYLVVSGQLLNRIHRRSRLVSGGLMVIADDHHLREDSRLSYRRMRSASVRGLTDGKLNHLLDTIYFGPSNRSRLLQAVDVLTYFEQRRRHVKERHPMAKRRMNNIGKSLDSVLSHDYIWTP
ncbi:hypothetical protein OC70_01925 [Micrococcus luteus]|uniref:DUF3800 domain-containing protein n=1 Tax=Micrococcus luteus TaxID=1270 RepID=UPI000597007F|nr:DUF3800 domain-containing protein [Micrococcus luteus]KIK89177.1 hypothetical protein OC70_01925 [Micrococcus luteus]